MSDILVFSLLWLTTVPTANMLDSRGLIEQALDEPAKIALDKVTLADAVRRLTEQTGVRIVMPPNVMRLAPYGGDTLIERVDIANVPLREGLARLFSPLGMYFVVEEDHVRVAAKNAILCLGRAPTWNELDTLAWLGSLRPGAVEKDRDELLSRVQCQGTTLPVFGTALADIGAGSGEEVLDVATAQHGLGWCLADRLVVVAPVEQLMRRRLQMPITLRIKDRPIAEALAALAETTNLPVRLEPGAISAVPVNIQRSYELTVFGQPAEAALDRIAADTGLGYLVNPDGVLFYRPSAQMGGAETTRPAGSSDPYVAKATRSLGDGRSFEWLIRASELPPDLRELRQKELEELFAAVRQHLAEERN